MLRRRKKILKLILIVEETGISKQDFENMLPLEKELFEGLMRDIESVDKKVSETLNGKTREEEKKELIVFKEDIEELIELDGSRIGPFEKGQITNISKEIARILIDDGKAELVIERSE